MWVNPSHPNPPRPSAPPTDSSTRLAVFPRPNREEIRLGISYYNNRAYIRAQIWAENDRGELWPLRGRSVTFRPDELAELIASLRSAERILERGHVAPPADDRPTYVDNRRRKPGRYDARDLPAPTPGAAPFNEFTPPSA